MVFQAFVVFSLKQDWSFCWFLLIIYLYIFSLLTYFSPGFFNLFELFVHAFLQLFKLCLVLTMCFHRDSFLNFFFEWNIFCYSFACFIFFVHNLDAEYFNMVLKFRFFSSALFFDLPVVGTSYLLSDISKPFLKNCVIFMSLESLCSLSYNQLTFW